jgi:GDPmannose 4,6-dehydratase
MISKKQRGMTDNAVKKAVITGITGQDGTYLTKFLLNKGYKVYGVITGLPGRDNFDNFQKLGLHESDIDKILLPNIPQILEDGVEIYNLAAQSSVGMSWKEPEITFEVNVNRYIKLLELCKGHNVKIFQASTAEMYGEQNVEALHEDLSMIPNNPYALSKYTSFSYGKLMRETQNMFISNGILFNHESPLRNEKFVLRKIIDSAKAIQRGEQEFIELGNLEIQRDWGFAEDYVEAIWQILQQETPLDVNIGTGSVITLKDMVMYIFNYFGIQEVEKRIKINPAFIRATDITSLKADVTKLNKLDIKLNPISQNSIRRLIEF